MSAHKGNAASLGSLGASTHLTNPTPGAVVSRERVWDVTLKAARSWNTFVQRTK